jgi:hypothetical protein
MTVVTQKAVELTIDDRIEKIYEECRSIAKQRLDRLGISTALLDRLSMADMQRMNETISEKRMNAEDAAVYGELRGIRKKLNKAFAIKNGLPERIADTPKLRGFLSSYIEKRAGRRFELELEKSKTCTAWVLGDYMGFRKGMRIIEFPASVEHELKHSEEPWMNVAKRYSDRRVHRLSFKFREGRALCTEMRLLGSEDDLIAAYNALDVMIRLTEPSPQLLVERGLHKRNKYMRSYVRASEGFREYYLLQEEVGEGVLEKLWVKCATAELVPGMTKDGRVVLMDLRRIEVFTVDMEKLRAGVTDIGELKILELPLFPEPKKDFPKS